MAAVTGSGETWGTGTYHNAKGGLGKNSTPGVRWRLPTRYDYSRADANGIRFVMPDMGPSSSGYEWSASVVSDNRGNAWLFNGYYGYLGYGNRYDTYGVRCVGR
jgi:hypothetical protein